MAGELHGLGTQFHRWNADLSTPAWEQICNIVSISGPSNTKDTLETTDLCTVDGFRTFIAGLKDAGEVALTMNYGKDVWEKLYADFESAENFNYAIKIPDEGSNPGAVLEFEGILTACPLEAPFDGLITSEVTIKISGKPVIDTSLNPVV